jgi:hypothetical protein
VERAIIVGMELDNRVEMGSADGGRGKWEALYYEHGIQSIYSMRYTNLQIAEVDGR